MFKDVQRCREAKKETAKVFKGVQEETGGGGKAGGRWGTQPAQLNANANAPSPLLQMHLLFSSYFSSPQFLRPDRSSCSPDLL